MNNSIVLSTFVKQLNECLEDIITTYPDNCKVDDRFLKCKMYFDLLKSTNPRLMILTWKTMVNERYREQILSGDVNFFVTKNYKDDAAEYYSDTVEGAINDLRNTINAMSPEITITSMKYIQNLCKLGDLYTT